MTWRIQLFSYLTVIAMGTSFSFVSRAQFDSGSATDTMNSTASKDPNQQPKNTNPLIHTKSDPNGRQVLEQHFIKSETDQQRASGRVFDRTAEITFGTSRAERMISILQTSEMQFAMDKIGAKGKDTLDNDKDLEAPATVLATAFALWAGRSMRVVRGGGIEIDGSVSARDRSSTFNIKSPLFNGQLQYNLNTGMNIGVNRTISSIDTSADFSYNSSTKAMSSQIMYQITPQIHLGVGSTNTSGSGIDNSARVMYQLSF